MENQSTFLINTELYTKEDEKLEKAVAAELEIPDPDPEVAEALLKDKDI